MAFLPQPALATRRARSSSRIVPIRCMTADSGAISISRRRRVFDLLSASETASPAESASNSTPHSSVIVDSKKSETPLTKEQREEIKAKLLQRVQAREALIRQDALNKQNEWAAEMDLLRTPPLPEPVEEAPVPSTPVPVVSSSPVVEAPPVQAFPSPYPSTESYPIPFADPEIESPSVVQEEEGNGSVSELYSPPSQVTSTDPITSLGKITKAISDAVGDVIESAQDLLGEVGEATNQDKKVEEVAAVEEVEAVEEIQVVEEVEAVEEVKVVEEVESVEVISEPVVDVKEPEPVEPENPIVEERSGRGTIGEVILDAIVEGVETPKVEEKVTVDKSEIIDLVDSGKVKNLTVTKLRRLLSSNGLKTSGRKAELIARLTSYAKS